MLLAALFAMEAAAEIIYSNYTAGQDLGPYGTSVSFRYDYMGWSGQRIAVGFTVGDDSYQIDSVTAKVDRYSGDASDFKMGIYSDNGGKPDLLLGYLNSPDFIGSMNDYVFSGGEIVVAANTQYWLVGEPSLNAPCDFYWADGNSGLGNQRQWSSLNPYAPPPWFDWGGRSYNDKTYSAIVEGTVVPEPTSMAAIGLVCSLGFFVRRVFVV